MKHLIHLKKILKGEYYLEKRTKLVVSHENHHYSALNEVVVMTDEPSKMLHFQGSGRRRNH